MLCRTMYILRLIINIHILSSTTLRQGTFRLSTRLTYRWLRLFKPAECLNPTMDLTLAN